MYTGKGLKLSERKGESLRSWYMSGNSPGSSAFSSNSNLIVAYLGSSVKDYLKNFLHTVAEQEWPCPICGEYLCNHGYYKRVVISEGGADSLPIFRGLCRDCKKTHAILPDFIAPYRHYSMPVISKAVEEISDKQVNPERVPGSQDICTGKRWHHRFVSTCNQAAGHLHSMAVQITGNIPSLVGKVTSSPWQRLKKALLNLTPIFSTSVMGAVNIWLTRDIIDIWL